MAEEHSMIQPFEAGQVREGTISYGLSSYGLSSYGLSSYGYDIRVAPEARSSARSTTWWWTRRSSTLVPSWTCQRGVTLPKL